MTLEDYREAFTSIGTELGDADVPAKFHALFWSLEKAPEVGLAIAHQEHQHFKTTANRPDFLEFALAGTITTDQWEQIGSGFQSFYRLHFAMESVIRYLHASGDLLAQLVRACLLRESELTEESCSLLSVVKTILGETDHPKSLTESLVAYCTSDPFVYVTDACNRMKHRDLMRTRQTGRYADDGEVTAIPASTPSNTTAGPIRRLISNPWGRWPPTCSVWESTW